MKKYLTPIIFSLGILIVIVLAVLALRSDGKSSQPESDKPNTLSAEDKKEVETGHSQGSDSATVVLTEFGDYQCPACGAAHPVIKNEILTQYEGKIRFVFKNFPLIEIHKNALKSAQATEAANAQGKFWQMHDILYEKQTEWSELPDPIDKFGEYALVIGIDADKFKGDLRSQKYADVVNNDLDFAKKIGLEGTPAFFVNGTMVNTQNEGMSAVKAAIDQALAK